METHGSAMRRPLRVLLRHVPQRMCVSRRIAVAIAIYITFFSPSGFLTCLSAFYRSYFFATPVMWTLRAVSDTPGGVNYG